MVGLPTGSLELAAFGASKLGLDKELEACLNKEPGALNRRDEKGRACLHHTASYGFEHCLDVLLGRPDIETDAKDCIGDTALHLAAINGFPMCAFNLTKAAPETCLIANNAGQTAIDVSVANDRGEVLNAMLLACAGISSAEALKSISALLEAGAVPDTWAPNGSSALMLAAAVDSVNALQVLLKNGATVELQDALGRTALMFAAGSGAVGALKALLDAGASLAARDRRGKGILDYAPPESPVRTILEDRMKVLEAAAEQLQAALLASLDEESSSKAQQAAASKAKRKGGKKGKKAKKDGATTPVAQPPPSAEPTAPQEESKEQPASKEEAQKAGLSGRPEEPQSEAESDSTAAEDDRGTVTTAAACISLEALGLHKDARASTSEDEEDWKVVGKSARKLHGKGTVSAAQPSRQQPQPSSQQQLTGTATPPQQRPAPYKRCPSATSLSDSTCSAESEQSMASASGPLHHHHTAQQHHVPSQQQQQQQSGASSQAAAAPARPAAATPPKPAPPRAASLLAKHNAGAATHAGSSRGGPASTAGPTGKQTVSPQVASPQQRADTWAGKVAGTSPKPSNAAGSATGEQCTTSQPSHQRDPPCAKPQARTPTACGAAGRSTSLPALDAAPQPTAANELAGARADAAVARRECLLLTAEVERLRTALACSEAARQQEVARLLQKAAHHESLAVEEAVRQEKAAMTGRLLSTFESLKGLNVLPGQPAATAPAAPKGLMGTLLDVQCGAVIGSHRAQPPAGIPPAEPFSAFGSPPRAGHNMAGAASLGAELSSLLCGMGAGLAAIPPPLNGSTPPEVFAPAPLGRCNSAAQPAAEPFSFFNGSSSIWK